MQRMGRFPPLCLSLVICVGCGSVKNGNNPDGGGGSFTLNATPAAINVAIAGTGVVTIAIDRVGQVGDITLSAPNLPPGITATFATNPVPDGTSSFDVAITVAPGTPPGT